MLRPHHILLTLALLLALVGDSWARSHRPSPRSGQQSDPPQTQSAQSQNSTAPDQRGTEQSPLIVKIAPSQESSEKAAADAKREDQKTANDEQVAKFTARLVWATVALSVIAFFQLLVFGWQGIQLKRTVQASIDGERPYIYPDHPNFARFLPSGAHAAYPTAKNVPLPIIEVMFANVGRTSAIIKEIRGEIVLDTLPEVPAFTYSPIRRRGEIIVRPDTITDPFAFEYSRNLTPDEMDKFGVGTRTIFLFGYVKYADAFGFLHTKGFCFLCRLGKPPIELAGGRSYNYSRSEKILDEYAT